MPKDTQIKSYDLENNLIKLIIDLVWSATDGGVQLKEEQFSHFEEPLSELEEIKSLFHTQQTKQLRELKEAVERLIPVASGECPACNRPTILGLHPKDSDEHVAFYKAGISDVLSLIEQIGKEDKYDFISAKGMGDDDVHFRDMGKED